MRTRFTELAGVEHPVVLGGMGSATVPELVAAVSEAGGLGIQGASGRKPEAIATLGAELRERTSRPFGLNLLLFMSGDAQIDAVLAARPAWFSTAWPRREADLRPIFERARAAGARVMHMVSGLEEAKRAAEAGADVIVAQGTEGGGHVSLTSTMVVVPMVARAVAPIPVLAAGGIADGAGLAASLMLGAEGVLMGTRFLATRESPWPASYKHAIVESDGEDTLLTEFMDLAKGNLWPGAFNRARRNRLVEDWAGREHEVRRYAAEVTERMARARREDDADNGELNFGQAAGLIDDLPGAGEVVTRMVAEAEKLLRERASLLGRAP